LAVLLVYKQNVLFKYTLFILALLVSLTLFAALIVYRKLRSKYFREFS